MFHLSRRKKDHVRRLILQGGRKSAKPYKQKVKKKTLKKKGRDYYLHIKNAGRGLVHDGMLGGI